MGFDFGRIEYDVPNDLVRIDGQEPRGWEFTRFDLRNDIKAEQSEEYVGVVARYLGDSATSGSRVQFSSSPPSWLKVYDAANFLEAAIRKLGGGET